MANPQISVTNTLVDVSVTSHEVAQITVLNSNPTISVTNSSPNLEVDNTVDVVTLSMENTSSEISVTNNTPILTVSDVGLQGASGNAATTWIGLVSGYNAIPTLTATIEAGDVYTYTYDGDITYYRLVPSGAEDDAFYSSFVDGVLSGLVVSKKLN